MLKKSDEQFIYDADFFEFLNHEFENTAGHATVEELAVFAFGSLEDAIEAYKENKAG